MLTRRLLLRSLPGAALLAAGLTSRASRALEQGRLRFIFVMVQGGWDPLCVFAPQFGNPSIDMEPVAQPGTVGNISFVDHPGRPAVRSFFESWKQRTVVLNGLSVRSVSHDICTQLMLTGTSSGSAADWATRVAAAEREQFALPHLVLGGPSFAGPDGTAVARSGQSGQLAGLLSGSILDSADVKPGRHSRIATTILDRYLGRRAGARAAGAQPGGDARMSSAFLESQDRATTLKRLQQEVELNPGATLDTQARTAVSALSRNLCRCVTVSAPGYWDTHANNQNQSDLFNQLFGQLSSLQALLASTKGPSGAMLAEDTMVVVVSEMGRTPRLNATNGRDHWPYTSALLIGPRLAGDRVVGQFNERYYGEGVDPSSGDTSTTAPLLNVEAFGATLLAMADVDPDPLLNGARPITGLLQ